MTAHHQVPCSPSCAGADENVVDCNDNPVATAPRGIALAKRWRGPVGSGKTAALNCAVSDAMHAEQRPIAWLAAVSDVGLRTERVTFTDTARARELEADVFEGRLVRELSSGERQRVRLALALSGQIKFAALDEPCRHLDPHHIKSLGNALRERNQQGMELVVSDLREQLDPSIFNDEQGTSVTPSPISKAAICKAERAGVKRPAPNPLAIEISTPFLLSDKAKKAKPTSTQTLRIPRASLIVLQGPNGSGKTSLLTAIAKAAKQQGIVYGYSRQEPEHQVFASSAYQEFAQIASLRTDTPWGGSDLMQTLGLQHWMHVPTPRLPLGVLCVLGTAIALRMGRDLVLLDEPTQGLDFATAQQLTAQLTAYCHEGACLIAASHDPELLGAAREIWTVKQGVLTTPEGA